MGRSSGQTMDGEVVSTAPGTLVWVRRRNGSWWPGLVMSPEGQTPRRRKGMPVKLLGKENGSMDWYDVEKSKRIKAFRCGEYDECIERAMKSLFCSSMSDRLGKYARRDDAIIHALEIEKSFCSDRDQELCSSSLLAVGCTRGHKRHCEPFTEPQLEPLKQNGGNSNLMTATKPMTLKKRRWKRLSAPDDGENKEIRRMRGLHDIGMAVRSKSESNTSHHQGGPEKSLSDNVSTIETELQYGLSCSRHETSSKNLGSPLKRGSPTTRVNVSSKRKKRRRPLSKVLASTEIVMPQFYCERETQTDLQVLDSSESKKTDMSVVINNSSDCSDNSCERTIDKTVDGCHPLIDGEHLSCHRIRGDPSSGPRFYAGCADNMFDIPVAVERKYSSDMPPASTSCLSNGIQLAPLEKQHVYTDERLQILQKKGVTTAHINDGRKNKESCSGSHLKTSSLLELGARMGENATDISNGSELYSPNDLFTSCKGNSHRLSYSKSSVTSYRSSQLARHGMVSSDSYGKEPLDQRSEACASRNVDASLRSRKRVTSSCTFADVPNDHSSSPHKKTKQTSFENFVSGPDLHCKTPSKGLKDVNMRIRSCSTTNLYDVNIDVQASHKGPRVPLVSLMSKLNGKAIVGHPIAVDSLDNGPMNTLLTGDDCLKNISLHPGSTGRQKGKTSCSKQANTCPVSSNVKVKFSKARKTRLMSKKMRKLSTISVGNEKRAEKAVGTTVVSCVPLMLVFSRINEALGRRL